MPSLLGSMFQMRKLGTTKSFSAARKQQAFLIKSGERYKRKHKRSKYYGSSPQLKKIME